MRPIISIIVPVYNVEAYLRQCLDSILSQTFTAWELILVDDGSPDGSGAICDEYAATDSRIHVFHIPNGGVSNARNVGMEAAKGDWITFIDSDDWVEEDFLDSLYAPVNNNNTLDFIQGGCKDFIEGMGYSINQQYESYIGEDHILLLEKFRGLAVSKLFRRDIIISKQLSFDLNIQIAEDYAFTLQYINFVNNFSFVDSTGYIYRYRRDSATKSNKPIPSSSISSYLESTTLSLEKYTSKFEIKEERAGRRWELVSNFIVSSIRKNGYNNIDNKCKEIIHYCLQNYPLIKYQTSLKRKVFLVIVLLFSFCYRRS